MTSPYQTYENIDVSHIKFGFEISCNVYNFIQTDYLLALQLYEDINGKAAATQLRAQISQSNQSKANAKVNPQRIPNVVQKGPGSSQLAKGPVQNPYPANRIPLILVTPPVSQAPVRPAAQTQTPNITNSSALPIGSSSIPATGTSSATSGADSVLSPIAELPLSSITHGPIVNNSTTGKGTSSTTEPLTIIIEDSPPPRTIIIEDSPPRVSRITSVNQATGRIGKAVKPDCAALRFAAEQYRNQNAGASHQVPQKKNEPPQNIAVMAKRSSPEDFFMPHLNTFLKDLTGWKVVNVESNISSILNVIRARFFPVPKIGAYSIVWTKRLANKNNFEIFPDQRKIELNTNNMLTCSRGNLINVMFHILIHCAVYETSAAKGRLISDHDANFISIMNHFNEKLGLEIGTDHTFLREASDGKTSWLCLCCGDNNAFRGIIKLEPDSEEQRFELALPHRVDGTRKFHKVFEVTRTINNNIDTRFVIHESFDNPKAFGAADTHQRVNIAPRELVDITEDEENSAPLKVVPMTATIDLDDTEFADSKKKPRKVVELMKNLPQAAFENCPFCSRPLEIFGGFIPHVDLCLGGQLR